MVEHSPRTGGGSWQHIVATDGGQIHAGHSYGDVQNIVSNHNYIFVLHQQRTLALGSSERIGVTACISGLRALTGGLHTRLSRNGAGQLPVAVDLLVGLERSRALLKDFENYFGPGSRIPLERASLVQVDQLVACFTSAVLLFSSIQQETRFIEVSGNFPEGDQDHESSLIPYVEKLTIQCEIWQTLLHLLQCSSEDEAHGASFTLEIQAHALLAESADLRHRLDSMENQISELSHSVDAQRYVDTGARRPAGQRQISLRAWEFEEVLQRSWVYQRNVKREETMSFRNSIAREHAWSEMSKLTLANASIISVIALPIKLSELEDSSWYRLCDPHLVRSSIVVVATPGGVQNLLSGQTPSIQPRNVEVARELKIETNGESTWPDDEAKSVVSLRVELMPKPPREKTPNYFKKARLWASRITPCKISGQHAAVSLGLDNDRSASDMPKLGETYLDNDDYNTLDVSDRGLYMIHQHDFDLKRYRAQLLVTSFDDIQRLLNSLQYLTQLRTLSLQGTGLKSIPGVVRKLSMLASLNISDNEIANISASLARRSRLRELLITGNPLESLPVEVWQMENLKRITVDEPVWSKGRLVYFQDLRWKSVESEEGTNLDSRACVELRRR